MSSWKFSGDMTESPARAIMWIGSKRRQLKNPREILFVYALTFLHHKVLDPQKSQNLFHDSQHSVESASAEHFPYHSILNKLGVLFFLSATTSRMLSGTFRFNFTKFLKVKLSPTRNESIALLIGKLLNSISKYMMKVYRARAQSCLV